MPRAQFKHPSRNLEILKDFQPPKNIHVSENWVTAVRRTIPEVPDVRRTDWFVASWDTTLRIIVIYLQNPIGDKATIAIDRQRGALK